MSFDELISREEILTGLPAKRANTLLFLIEKHVAQIVAKTRITFSLNDPIISDREQVFLQAFASVDRQSPNPTIQQIERYASGWASLIPETAKLKAALIHTLSQKYKFSYHNIPNIRTFLELDQPAIRAAYSRLYRTPIEKIYLDKLPITEQIRWILSGFAQRIESLPPFWLATLITVALGLPQAFLALPIAVADIGPLTAIAFLILIGIINILTIACMAESIGRSGDFHSGNAFIKQLAGNYLGKAGSSILSLAVGIRVFLIALACYIGLATTMANITPIPAQLWAVVLFLSGGYILLRKSTNFTVAIMIFLAIINISLLLLVSLSTFAHLQWQNLFYINLPFLGGDRFFSGTLQQFIGVSLMLYFGHVYVAECSKIVLPRDPSASSLIRGSIVGTAFLTVLFCIWVLAVNGAIPPQVLAGYSGTVLDLIALEINPAVKIWGAILVILLLGMAWIRSSSLLLNLANEWLPTQLLPVLTLSSRQSTLIFSPRNNSAKSFYLGLTYLGLKDNQPLFHIEIQLNNRFHRLEKLIAPVWHIQDLFEEFPQLSQENLQLKLTVQSADSHQIRLQATTSMLMSYTGILKTEAKPKSSEQHHRQTRFSWLKLLQQGWKNWTNKSRFFLSISPLVLVFLIVEALFLTGIQSFTTILAFAGVLGNSLVGGIFPILLLVSSRCKGERVPGVVLQILDHRLLRIGLYSTFILILLLHGLFIWELPIARISAVSLALFSLGATVIMEHHGAFASRVVVELGENKNSANSSILNITAGGYPKLAEICLGYPDGEQFYETSSLEIFSLSSLRYIILNLSTEKEKEIRVWTHHNTSTENSQKLPTFLEVNSDSQTMQFDLKLSKGQILLPTHPNKKSLKLTLRELSAV